MTTTRKTRRKELRQLARQRLIEAKLLLKHGHPSGAYYLAGYSVECALKACIAKQTVKYEFPDKNQVTQSHTHDLDKLLNLAGLGPILDVEAKDRPKLEVNWTTIKDWREDSRYDTTVDVRKAKQLLESITEKRDGVFTWLRNHW